MTPLTQLAALPPDLRERLEPAEEYETTIVHDGVTIEFDSDILPIDVVHLADAALAAYQSALERVVEERDVVQEQATILLDSIFQTVDLEDGEAIVAEAFPGGGPEWVLAWYREHPDEEESAARAAAPEPKET